MPDDPTPPPVAVTTDEHQVTTIRIDDGKANALSPRVIDQIDQGLTQAEAEGRAALVIGRPGRFSAGFDLSVMQEGPEAAIALVRRGAEMALRMYELPIPVVVACTGHALAMGAILLLASDVRIGAEGDFKIGLNEVAIGMPVPVCGPELARDRLSRRHFPRAVSTAAIYDSAGALEAGYLDELAPPDQVVDIASQHARALAQQLDPTAFRATRVNARAGTLRYIRETLDADLGGFAISGS